MHELGVVIKVVETVEDFAKKNNLKKVDTLVLQIGELSSMIPRYVEACYPAAVDGTSLEETKLKIEVIPANVLCKSCENIFSFSEQQKRCPQCESEKVELLSGKEFLIKEVIAC
ncbi:hydrogenase maturation nickel metallochaperone HypA [Proteinivorax hydrogeniformans]|uniref:Hydrogenase maturation factor HypA n=1 Tax=Proteinivorax hydrogeniformans TaxID=1826727 RepID=A0AAU8HT32_9FIRM